MMNLRIVSPLAVVLALSLSGCGSRASSPEDLQPGVGGIDTIASQAEGVGMGASPRDPILDMGMIAMDHWVQPSVPVIKNARAIHAWFYPQKVGNGRTLRDGFYAYHVIEDFSWGMWDAMHRDAINLQALGSISVNPDGGLQIDPRMLPAGTPTDIPERQRMSMGHDPKHFPYTTESDGGTNVVIVDENTQTVQSFRTETSPVRNTPGDYPPAASSGVRTGNGEVDLDAVRNLIQRAQSQAQEINASQRPIAMPTPDGGIEVNP